MTDKGKERITRACHHTILLHVKDDDGNWLPIWECAEENCDFQLVLDVVLQ